MVHCACACRYELEAASSTALAFSARHRLAFASTLQGTVHALRVNTSLADAATLRTRLTYQDADTSHTMRHGQSDSATSGAVHAEAGRVLIAADKGGAVVLECVWRIQLSRNGRTMPIFSTPVVVEDVHADTSGLLVVSSVDGRLHGLSLSGGDKVSMHHVRTLYTLCWLILHCFVGVPGVTWYEGPPLHRLLCSRMSSCAFQLLLCSTSCSHQLCGYSDTPGQLGLDTAP